MSRYNSAFALLLNEGTCTSDGSVSNNTLVDSALIGKNNFLTYNMVEIISGGARLETRDITAFNSVTGTITVHQAFSTQILTGVGYRVYAIKPENIPVQNATTNLLMRDVVGNKTDTAATPSNTTSVVAIVKQVYDVLDTYLPTTDNNYSTTGALDFTTEKTVFEISDDTRYEILNPWIDITPFTNTATITFQFYRSVAAAGGTYRKAGDTITKVVGTDNPIIEFGDYAHYGYTKITAVSDNAGDSSVDVPFGYIKKPLE